MISSAVIPGREAAGRLSVRLEGQGTSAFRAPRLSNPGIADRESECSTRQTERALGSFALGVAVWVTGDLAGGCKRSVTSSLGRLLG